MPAEFVDFIAQLKDGAGTVHTYTVPFPQGQVCA